MEKHKSEINCLEDFEKKFNKFLELFKELGIDNIYRVVEYEAGENVPIDDAKATEKITVSAISGKMEPLAYSMGPEIWINFEENRMSIYHAQNIHILKLGRLASKYGFRLSDGVEPIDGKKILDYGPKIFERVSNDKECSVCKRACCDSSVTIEDCKHYNDFLKDNSDIPHRRHESYDQILLEIYH